MGIKDAFESTRRATPGTQAQSEPDPGDHYDVVVNKGDLSVVSLTRELNKRWKNGWRLSHVLEQHGNTVLVFERRERQISDAPGPGWWKASDGRWYPPDQR